MSKELHIALQEAIGDLGTDVLKSPYLVNVLQDYGAFDVHDNNKAQKKDIIASLVSEGYVDNLFKWKRKKQSNWRKENEKFLVKLIRRYEYSQELVDDISSALIDVVELPPNITTSKSNLSLFNFLFGGRIPLKEGHYFALGLGFTVELIILFCTLLGDINHIGGIIFSFFLLVAHIAIWCLICSTLEPKINTNPGTEITLAFLTGEIITIVIPILIVSSELPYSFSIFFLTFNYVILYLVGRYNRSNHWKLFCFILAALSMILIIIYVIPLFIKQRIIKENETELEIERLESVTMREKHLSQTVALGFMGINIGDSYYDVVNRMKKDSNVVNRIKIGKEAFAYIDFFDIGKDLHPILKDVKVPFDKELQYDVSFDNDTVRLYLLFYSSKVQYIGVNVGNAELYTKKYGKPEKYHAAPSYGYTPSHERSYISKIERYPFFNNSGYSSLKKEFEYYQWTFANGIICIRSYSTDYISNDVLDTIQAMQTRRKEQQEEIEKQQKLEQVKRRQQQEQQKKDSLNKLEEERKRKKLIHSQAINQI